MHGSFVAIPTTGIVISSTVHYNCIVFGDLVTRFEFHYEYTAILTKSMYPDSFVSVISGDVPTKMRKQ